MIQVIQVIEDRKSQIASMSYCFVPQKADVGKKSPHMQQVLGVACHLLFSIFGSFTTVACRPCLRTPRT